MDFLVTFCQVTLYIYTSTKVDRGFDIKDTVGAMMAEAKIPGFTRGKDQLAPVDIEMIHYHYISLFARNMKIWQ